MDEISSGLITCPECGTWDFDVDEELETGYCTKSCGAIFKMNNDGSTITDPYMRIVVSHIYEELKRQFH